MNVELITRDDLNQFKDELVQELKAIVGQPRPAKEWLRSAEVRKLLNISAGTLQSLRVKGVIPFRKVGGILYYQYTELHKALENGRTAR
jgi:hypothetical protein